MADMKNIKKSWVKMPDKEDARNLVDELFGDLFSPAPPAQSVPVNLPEKQPEPTKVEKFEPEPLETFAGIWKVVLNGELRRYKVYASKETPPELAKEKHMTFSRAAKIMLEKKHFNGRDVFPVNNEKDLMNALGENRYNDDAWIPVPLAYMNGDAKNQPEAKQLKGYKPCRLVLTQ